MSPLNLSTHLTLFGETEDGPAQLKGHALQLASRGKLLPSGDAAPSMDPDGPWPLPTGWSWSTLERIADFELGKTPSTREDRYWSPREGTPWISIGDMVHYGRTSESSRSVTASAIHEVFKRDPVPAGTLLMSFKLTIGKVTITDVEAFHNEAIISIYPKGEVLRDYLFYLLPLLAAEGSLRSAIKGATLNRTSLKSIPIPLPSLEVQQAIVDRLEVVFDLCDELGRTVRQRNSTRQRIVNSLCHELLASASRPRLITNWEQIAGNLELHTATRESREQLWKTLLLLAVHGRFTSKDWRADTPVAWLDDARAKDGKALSAGAVPFGVPATWKLVATGSMFSSISTRGKQVKASQYENAGAHPVVSQSAEPVIAYTNDSSKLIQVERPVVVFGDHTRQVKYVDFDFVVGADGVKILRPDSSVDPKFFYYVLRSFRLEERGYGRHFGLLTQQPFPIPPSAEQSRIIQLIEALEALFSTLSEKTCRRDEFRRRIVELLVVQL